MLRKYIVSFRDWYLVHIKWRKYSIGNNFHAGKNVVLWAKHTIEVGDNCYIGRNSQIETDIQIGNNVLIANNVAIIGKYDHHYQEIGRTIRNSSQIRDNSYNWKGLASKTVIEDDVWIGYGSIILSGVVIKSGSIIAAGSVVVKDTEAYCIYGGNPAQKISNRFENKQDLKQHLQILKGKQ